MPLVTGVQYVEPKSEVQKISSPWCPVLQVKGFAVCTNYVKMISAHFFPVFVW